MACHQGFLNRPAFHYLIFFFFYFTFLFFVLFYVFFVLQSCIIDAWEFEAGTCFHVTVA